MLEYNRNKFLKDVALFEDQNLTLHTRRNDVVEERQGIRRAKDRLTSLQHERSVLGQSNKADAKRPEYDKTIDELRVEISQRESWIATLEEGLASASERNQKLGLVIHGMRKLLTEHNVDDPSRVVLT